MILPKKSKSTRFVQFIRLYNFPCGKVQTPKIIKNRLNFAPTHVYTGQQNQVDLKIRDFKNKVYLKSTTPIMLYPLGTDAVAVYGFQPNLIIASRANCVNLLKRSKLEIYKDTYIELSI